MGFIPLITSYEVFMLASYMQFLVDSFVKIPITNKNNLINLLSYQCSEFYSKFNEFLINYISLFE